MEFGKQRSPKSEGAGAGTILLAFAFCATLGAVVLSSCGDWSEKRRASAFSISLGSLDALISTGPLSAYEKAFVRATKNARLSADWLSLLKRGRAATAAGESGRFAKIADQARKAFPESEAIAAAAAFAYARSGRSNEALALFDSRLSPEARPSLWAEAFVVSQGALTTSTSPVASVKSADYGRLAEITGDIRAYLGATITALATGDKPEARAWLEKGLASGIAIPPELLWDCGFFEVLSERPDISAGSGELALMGDAAWMMGDSRLARRRWERSISLSPHRSWKAYVDLALMSKNSGEAAASYWARLRAAFLASPASETRDGALGAYATHLAREGRDAEALSLLADLPPDRAGALAVVALTIKDRNRPEGRFAADLERLTTERPTDPEVLGAALRALSIRGMNGEVALLRAGASRRAVTIEYGWYYDAVVLTARGDFSGAVKAITLAAGDSDPVAAFALGSLHAAMGDALKSVEDFSRSAAWSRGGRERCTAFKALGKALGDSGNLDGAAAAYKSAASADPSDSEAAILARGVSRTK